MKIMVFLHGAIIMQRAGQGVSRATRVQQVQDREESVYDFASYIPIGGAVRKLRAWQEQGADIVYFTFRGGDSETEVDRAVLSTHGFPAGPLLFRQNGETYADLATRVMPEMLIEDDCESIGGEAQMTSPHLPDKAKAKISCIVVKEFEGIDHLPDNLQELVECRTTRCSHIPETAHGS